MKKVYLLLVVVAILGLLVGGCWGTNKGPVTITVVNPFNEKTPFNEKDVNRDNFVNAYKAYETATGNTVTDLASASSEEWKQSVIDSFKNGTEPDVLFFFTGADADDLVKSGKLVSISDIRKVYPDYANNMKQSLMPVSADGRSYAVPVNGYWEGLFVNKNVLKECGVDLPGADYTWEQFLDDCQKIKDKGYTPIACSLGNTPHYWFEFVVFNNGSINTHLNLPGSSNDTSQVWAEGLRDLKELYDSGFFPENTLDADDSEIFQLMFEDKAAFMIDGHWAIGSFQEAGVDLNDFMVTYVPAKGEGERTATQIIGGFSMGYYITKKAWDDPAKRKACVEFVMAMTTDEVVSAFAKLSVNALAGGALSPEDVDPLGSSALAMTKGCTGIIGAVQDKLATNARATLFADIKDVVTGVMTPEEAIDKLR